MEGLGGQEKQQEYGTDEQCEIMRPPKKAKRITDWTFREARADAPQAASRAAKSHEAQFPRHKWIT